MKKNILLLLIIVFSAGCTQAIQKKFVLINNTKIDVEIADTPDLRYQGLSDREGLCDNCGMLFVFPDKQTRFFVMRRMNFPLDIIWIEDNKIVNIEKNLAPERENPAEQYSSDLPVNYVLEVNAGFNDKNDIKTGDSIEFNFK